ncbi:hypothetical protein DL765_000569 [Monosporascus sp. GIB2]|nr:hypothetical protein DL765_000569 [Monosporascus sp. GIB2]
MLSAVARLIAAARIEDNTSTATTTDASPPNAAQPPRSSVVAFSAGKARRTRRRSPARQPGFGAFDFPKCSSCSIRPSQLVWCRPRNILIAPARSAQRRSSRAATASAPIDYTELSARSASISTALSCLLRGAIWLRHNGIISIVVDCKESTTIPTISNHNTDAACIASSSSPSKTARDTLRAAAPIPNPDPPLIASTPGQTDPPPRRWFFLLLRALFFASQLSPFAPRIASLLLPRRLAL